MKVQVSVNNVKIIEPSILNENEYNIHECEFEFTEEYNGLTKKAVFTNEANETYVETIVDNICSIPSEVLKDKENVKLGVYAYDVDNEELLLRYSPRPTEFYVHEGSYKEGQNSTPPTPSEIEQLQAQITTNANDIDTLETTKADKTEIPTKTSDLINDSNFASDANYVHTDNNFTDEDEAQITQNKNDISTLQNTKADKSEIPTKVSELDNDSGFIDKDVDDLTNYTKTSDLSSVATSGDYNDLSNKPTIPANTSDLNNDSGFITKDVNNLTYYTLKTNTGSLIDLEINGTTYVITLSLKDQDGNVISTDTIDLPLESVVVGGSYDAVNKKIVLTLENGNTVDIPVGDLIAGLQTEITSQNKLASDLVDDTNSGNKFVTTSEKQTWNAKYDKPVGGIPSTDLASDVLTDYVKNTDYATNEKGGVVKVSEATYGIGVASNGTLLTRNENYANYQSKNNYFAISKGTLENVITGKGLVSDTDYATSEKGGTIKVNDYYGFNNQNGVLKGISDTYQRYNSYYPDNSVISKGTLENVITGKNLETANNKVTSISNQSTDTQYPSAKCVYDELEAKQDEIDNLETEVEDLRNASLKVTGTGTDITLNNTASARLLDIELKGKTEQTQLTGKNLINIFGENAFEYGSGVDRTTVSQNGTITTTANFASSRNKGTLIENLEQNTNYTVSLFVDSIITESASRVEVEAIAYNADNTYNSVIFQQLYNNPVGATIQKTFNSGSYDKIAIHVSGYYTNTTDTGTVVYNNYMVEQGSTATSYEPYCGRHSCPKSTDMNVLLKM